MQKRINIKAAIVLFISLVSTNLAMGKGEDALSNFTPYSMFGLGTLASPTNSMNMGMGGIGVGVRDNHYINIMNPASITERDTLSFMFDVSFSMKNIYSKDGVTTSAYNTATIQSLMFTTPLYKKSAMAFGIQPYSEMGYEVESEELDTKLVADYGDIRYKKYGSGSLYEAFFATAMDIRNFTVGAQFGFIFGSLDRSSDVVFGTLESLSSIYTDWSYQPTAYTLKLGLQYHKEFGENKDRSLTLGATWRLQSRLTGLIKNTSWATRAESVSDTTYYSKERFSLDIPDEISFGASYRKRDKWMVGFDIKYQDWSGAQSISQTGIVSKLQAASSARVGFEYTPNKYDIRYYLKRITYRVGAYYEKSYLNVNGNSVDAKGFTIGLGFPVYRLNNALNFSVDVGQRGSLNNGLIKENYVNFVLNISLHDIWFIKQLYQ